MTAESILYAVAGFVSGSLLVTIFLCLVLRATEPKRDVTAEIMDGLREPMWKTKITKERKHD